MLTRKFGRTIDHRENLLKNLTTSLLLHERAVTTTAKAKDVRSLAERLINIGKEGGLDSYRRLRAFLFDTKSAKKVIEELGPRYRKVTGGYVLLHPLGPRPGDGAPMSLLELRAVRDSERPAPVKKKISAPSPEGELKSDSKKTVAKKKRKK